MGKKKDIEDSYIPVDVKVSVRIIPAFKVVIESDSMGVSWSGHSWYGDTAIDALRSMRNSLKTKQAIIDGKVRNQYGHISASSITPELVAATSWKEPKFD